MPWTRSRQILPILRHKNSRRNYMSSIDHNMRVAKYQTIIQRPIFKGAGDSNTGRVLMLMVRRHMSFVFEVRSSDINPALIPEYGVIVWARPEKLPNGYDGEFIEVVEDKLAEMREEFAFAIELMKVI
jgi:hypothetical protein